MKKILSLLITSLLLQPVFGQQPKSNELWKTNFRAFAEKVNDMVHTKLDARFDYQKSQLNGKVWLTLKPHFYDVDSVLLDAKGMDIHTVQLASENNAPLKFTYDSLTLHIKLGKKFTAQEKYTVYIEYTAKPNQFKAKGSNAISDAKGLYFINPLGADKNKPTQIWTQGETEGNSVWIPIIDRPNQKSTEEFILTVPDQYVTLSNGSLVSQNKNADGTRTDTWKMEQPHAPYLFFMGIGDYAIVRDSYNGKEVNYYVEKEYKDVARKIFGYTPEMMKFYSEKLGVEFPWAKYSQMTARDYVSGAMENTTSTLHGEWAQQNKRQLIDGNNWESVIAHELFHQWFGDYVTCESWSNLTVNESFADFSQIIWAEYKHGADEGDAERYNHIRTYLSSNSANKPLVRYHYADKEDMFDAVSYAKGGAILAMLKSFMGEDAFYKSLNLYLTRNSFGNGNARKLQQAFEDITGKDLNWFFNQWYFGAGHPELNISYGYDEQKKEASVYIKQTQSSSIFKLPLFIDVYQGDKVARHSEWIKHEADTFRYKVDRKPDLIDVDADRILIADKKDTKTLAEYIFQFYHSKKYIERWESIIYASEHSEEPEAIPFLKATLKDPFYRTRRATLRVFKPLKLSKDVLTEVETLAKKDPNVLVKAEAIAVLAAQKDKKYKNLFVSNLKDSSYSVAGNAYAGLIDIDEKTALMWLPQLKTDAKGALEIAVKKAEILTKTDADFDELYSTLSKAGLQEKFQTLPNFLIYLRKVNNVSNFKKGIDLVLQIRDAIIPYVASYKDDIAKELTELKQVKSQSKSKEAAEQIKYVDDVLKK